MLIAAVSILGIVVLIGLVLGSLYILYESPPTRVMTIGWLHGVLGATGVIVLLLALRGPARGVAQGAGAFGWVSGAMLTATLAGGLLIVLIHMRRRAVPPLLIAMHGTLGVAGYVLLAAYFSSKASIGH
jgi:hypothetical protein